ncbi:unnamed protein product [Rotaria socialis]|uniref:non-specific serine/threonine protein kinase n=1 Tax=Rotaria socialis TaxID=392032 RepID=A0A818VSK3_9BILA|nr:unnamed protein product [Rotaria socialis]CAF4544191.1 unnamed protein product [Rotaria socialis]
MFENINDDVESRLNELEHLLFNSSIKDQTVLGVEALLDAFIVLYDECCNSTLRREKTIAEFIEYAKSFISRVKRCRFNRNDFETIKIIGRGAFGEVAVVKLKNTDRVFAMKTLNKWEMLKRADTACFREERDVLVFGDPHWLTKLHYAFQDGENLYFIMDYYYGGDLLTLLSKFDDHFSEEMTRFYVAEMVLAIDSLHKLGYVHRDIKPDNVLLDGAGHIRLADFGSCLRMRADGTVQSNVAVGTPDYISPEILRAMEAGQGRYGPECDWWSLGCAMWEMLFGLPPFYAESLLETYGKIMMHVQKELSLPFPNDIEVSDSAKDLLQHLLCSIDIRLGKNGLDDFKNHPFFTSIDWENLRQATAPYVPVVNSPSDTSNFDVDDIEPSNKDVVPPVSHAAFTGHHLPFIGFTHSANNRYSDGAKTTSIVSNPTVIISTSPSDICDSTNSPINNQNSEYEETINSLKLQHASLLEELKRLREVYEQTKSDSLDQIRQIKTLEDFYTNQYEISNNEQIQYLIKILNLFQNLRGLNENLNEEHYSSIDDIKNQLNQHLIYFSTSDKTFLLNNNHQNQDKQIVSKPQLNNLSLFLTKFEQKFSHLFTNNLSNELDETIENENDDELDLIASEDLLLKRFSSFLKDIYEKIKSLLRDKSELDEKLIFLEEKRVTYSRWETQMYDILKWINEEKSARSHLKGLANKMAEELDQIRETTSPLLTIGSTSSSLTTAGASVVHNTAWKHGRSVKLKHMEIQQLQTSLQKEIDAKQRIQEEFKECQAENILKAEENLRLKEDIEKLQKQLVYEQSKQLVKSPAANHNVSDELSTFINNTSIDRFLRNVTAGLSDSPALLNDTNNDLSGTFDDGSSGGDDSSRTMSGSNNKSQTIRPLAPLRNELHDFMIANFHVTAMCDDCQNALIGIVQQGFVCQRCKLICHPECMEKISTPCRPSIKDRSQTMLLDQHLVRIPKAGGIKKGWNKYQLLNLQTKLLFYELSSDQYKKITWPQPAFIIDLTDDEFLISSVTSSDAYHANKKDVSSIFKISILKLSSPKQFQHTLVLTNNESEKNQYVNMLSDLSTKVKTLKQNGATRGADFIAKELFDTSKCSSLKETTAVVILDQDRIIACGEDGLYLLDILKDSSTKLSDKRVHQLSLISNGELLVTLAGKQRTIRLQSVKSLLDHPLSSLDSKIIETKNATTFAVHSTSLVLCVAIKNRILVYQLFSTPKPYHYSFIREFNIIQNVTYLEISTININQSEQQILWYGYPSTFVAQRLDQQCPSVSLVRDEDPTLQFFRDRPIEALRVVPVTNSSSVSELLLVFRELGIYVSCATGMRTRHKELMWTALPLSTSFSDPYLLIYTEKSVDIYDVPSATWLQSLPLCRTRSLTPDGCICLSHDPELLNHHSKLLYLMQKTNSNPSLNVPERASSKSLAARGGRFRVGGSVVGTIKSTTSSSIAPISGPKDFTHISHLGKGEGLQIISGLKQVSPTSTLSSINHSSSGSTLNNNNRRSLISGPQNFVHLTHIGPSDISTFASDLSTTNTTTNRAVISAPMNFRHQVHIGHNDEIDQLHNNNNNNNNNKGGTYEQQTNSVLLKQQQVTSSGNSTLSSQSLSFKDEDDSDQPLE